MVKSIGDGISEMFMSIIQSINDALPTWMQFMEVKKEEKKEPKPLSKEEIAQQKKIEDLRKLAETSRKFDDKTFYGGKDKSVFMEKRREDKAFSDVNPSNVKRLAEVIGESPEDLRTGNISKSDAENLKFLASKGDDTAEKILEQLQAINQSNNAAQAAREEQVKQTKKLARDRTVGVTDASP